MLKTRLIAALPVKDGVVVQSLGFRRYLPVGRPEIAVDHLNRWGIDEIAILDIDATPRGGCVSADLLGRCAAHLQVPLAAGGGLRSLDQIRQAITAGADKVVLNTAAIESPRLIREGAETFGTQAVVVSIDARRGPDGGYRTYVRSAAEPTGRTPVEAAREAERRGAGEILLTSIDRDGSKAGYDLELVSSVAAAVSIPVIACGGAFEPAHFIAGIEAGASAVAAANVFHYSEHSATVIKRGLIAKGARVRLDSYATYEKFRVGDSGRIEKLADSHLEHLRFAHFAEEVI